MVRLSPSSPWLVVLALAARTGTVVRANKIAIGDKCGVDGADFLDDSFTGEFRVAGGTSGGCTIGAETDCYCSPIIGDTDPLGEWIWQCNPPSSSTTDGAALPVPFGPAAGKTCPSEIPVPFGFDGGEQQNPLCDIAVHPTGQENDPPCAYSDCAANGGNQSAVCGCVDETFGQGGDEESNFRWYCLHATCHCGATEDESSAKTWMVVGGPVVATVVAMLFSL